ncbi:CRISPR-associated endonuclease Cas9 [bacterium BMS3Abin07]|nr:CRISPR-associated endonuclease Cas9 [bacterium BMS3Abin07]GBE31298.1 CRISPR-associated endonuclease Cas9 [bacterium BMS3Bbin05]HDO22157.1 HNH endonuclease [Nitrospirota bacterium]HDZ88301.1 HNH endonuclease [Nitrospirota bacterium]
MDYFISTVSDKEIKREKQKARDLRRTQWWKRKCSEGRCYYCGRNELPGELTMDHIVPVIRGGKSTKNNVVPACKECNNRKKHSLPLEWDEYLKRLEKEKID